MEADNETPQPAKPKDPTVDVRAVLRRLDTERKRLSKEEERIRQQREQLEDLKEEIEDKIERLSKVQKQIAADLELKLSATMRLYRLAIDELRDRLGDGSWELVR